MDFQWESVNENHRHWSKVDTPHPSPQKKSSSQSVITKMYNRENQNVCTLSVLSTDTAACF